MYATSLKQILLEKIKIKRYVTLDEVKHIAILHGNKLSTAERRLRNDSRFEELPIVRYGASGEPITGSQPIVGYGWKENRTTSRKISDTLQKRPKRKKYVGK